MASVWLLLEARFRRHPETRAGAVSPSEFDRAFAPFGAIDSDYREFVFRHGGGLAGAYPIYGLRKAEWMGAIQGRATAPALTALFRERGWPGVDQWLVFSIDQGGNPVGFAPDGTVWLSDQLDFHQVVQLATCFEDYLRTWCLNTGES